MAMSREQMDALVQRLEPYARRRPGSYRLRVSLLAALGYAYLFLILAVVCALIGLLAVAALSGHASILVGKLGWLLITLVVIILRALWVRMEPPQGIELTRAETPLLFKRLDELTTALRAPRFHHVLLTGEFNAGVVQVPRLGIFGWQRNYLLLGLPLMQALSPAQFGAVVAHELGHLSRNHSRFAGWVYRVRQTWNQLLERLASERHPGGWLFIPFLNWFAPFFSAYTFVLARADEYVADHCAAEMAGKASAAEALIHLAIKGEFLQQDFWPNLYKSADRQEQPPAATFTALAGVLRRGVTAVSAARWLDQQLAEKTSSADTHPCLADRLAALAYLPAGGDAVAIRDRLTALGYRPEEPGEAAAELPTAAQALLGEADARLTARVEQAWREAVLPHWQERHRQATEARAKLDALDERALAGPLPEEEALQRARWTAEFRTPEAAIPLFEAILTDHPEHAVAHYALGEILLDQQDERGIEHLERAMAADPDAVLPGCQVVYAFLKKQGRIEAAAQYRRRAEDHYELLVLAAQERAGVSQRDRFEPHGLPAEAVARLREQLSGIEGLRAAYLARKMVKVFPEKPYYVLVAQPDTRWYQFHSDTRDAKLSQAIATQLQLPGQGFVVVLGSQTRGVGKNVRKVAGAELYRR